VLLLAPTTISTLFNFKFLEIYRVKYDEILFERLWKNLWISCEKKKKFNCIVKKEIRHEGFRVLRWKPNQIDNPWS
jgi:hypothetical protein